MAYRLKRWALLAPGDPVRLRPKRSPGPRLEVTVAGLLARDRADGLGFIDDMGVTFREYYYDVEVLTTPAS